MGEYIFATVYETVPITRGDHFTEPWECERPVESLADSFEGWEPELTELLRMPKSCSRWAIHVVDDLSQFNSGPVALIGDASHAMTPHQGLGAGLAIEDAYVMSLLLSHPSTTKSNINDVLKIYDEVRRPFAQRVAKQSLDNGLMYDFAHPEFQNSTLEVIGTTLGASCTWLEDANGFVGEGERAEALLSSGKVRHMGGT